MLGVAEVWCNFGRAHQLCCSSHGSTAVWGACSSRTSARSQLRNCVAAAWSARGVQLHNGTLTGLHLSYSVLCTVVHRQITWIWATVTLLFDLQGN